LDGNGVDAKDIERRWLETLARMSELVPMLESIDLKLRATGVAKQLQLRDAAALRQWLAARELPPFQLVRDWYYVVALAQRFSAKPTATTSSPTVSDWALCAGQSSSVYYSFVKRVTGDSWKTVRDAGSTASRRRALKIWEAYRRDGSHFVEFDHT
jgi:hypothetical protein